MARHVRALLAAGTGLALLVTSTAPAAAGRADKAKLSGKVTVFAATSLPAVFTQIAKDFHKKNPGVTVEFTFRASGTLAEQIQQGAPADVFAPADQENMSKVADEVSGKPVVFARNRLEIAVQKGNPQEHQDPGRLGRPQRGRGSVLAGHRLRSVRGPSAPTGERAGHAEVS